MKSSKQSSQIPEIDHDSQKSNSTYLSREDFWKKLVDMRKPGYLSAYNLTKSKTHAEDLVQETVAKLLKNRKKFKSWTNFKAWFLTSLYNQFVNDYRKKEKTKKTVNPEINEYFVENSLFNARKQISLGEYDTIHEQIMNLKEDQKSAFILYYQWYKYDEIAELLQAPLGTIKSRIFFARKELIGNLTMIDKGEFLW